jgi:hypothetical protein
MHTKCYPVTEGMSPFERLRHRCENNIKMDVKETGYEGMNWTQVALDNVQQLALVNKVTNLIFIKD